MFFTFHNLVRRNIVAMLFIGVAACTDKQYILTINNLAPDKSKRVEEHNIYANNDSTAYVQATVLFYLALHAYNKIADESKPYVTQPVDYMLLDEHQKNVDSLLGSTTTNAIKASRKSLIN